MNEIAKLIEAYNRLWSDIEIMQQDVINIIESDFGMELFHSGDDLGDNLVHSICFKDKIILYVIIDVSVEIPFLQIFKLDLSKSLKQRELITSDYLKKEGYKGWNPNDVSDEEETKKGKAKDVERWENSWMECIVSPKIDILSINSTDIVNSEIKNLLSYIMAANYKGFSSKELKIIE